MFIEMEKKNSQKLKKFPSSLWKMVARKGREKASLRKEKGGDDQR